MYPLMFRSFFSRLTHFSLILCYQIIRQIRKTKMRMLVSKQPETQLNSNFLNIIFTSKK